MDTHWQTIIKTDFHHFYSVKGQKQNLNPGPDQLASEEANWSGSALFVIEYANFYQKPDQVIWLAGN